MVSTVKAEEATRKRQEAGERAKANGRVAEKEISLLCSQANLSANPAVEDENGWDFYIQYPTSLDASPFLDAAPAAHSCFLQIKASEDAMTSCRMTLANALKLAKSPLPSFVVGVHVVDLRARAIWLRHCDEEFVRQTLEAAAKATGDRRLNDIELSFPFVEPAFAPDGTQLRDNIGAHLSHSPYHYILSKRDWLENLGYEGERSLVRLTPGSQPTDSTYEALAALAVGERNELTVEGIEIFDKRFGLARPGDKCDSGVLSLPTPPCGPTVDLEISDGENNISLRCQSVIARLVFPFIPERFERFVLRAPFFSLEGRMQGEEFLMSWSVHDFTQGVKVEQLGQLAQAVRAMRMIQNGGASMMARGLTRRNLSLPGRSSEQALPVLQALEDATIVIPRLCLSPAETIPYNHILAQNDALLMISAASTARSERFATVFDDYVEGDDFPPDGSIVASAFICGVRFCGVSLVAVVAIVGRFHLADGEHPKPAIRSRSTRLMSPRIFRENPPSQAALRDEVATALNEEGISEIIFGEHNFLRFPLRP